jgi:IclR family pca regulon transcriptional regulator
MPIWNLAEPVMESLVDRVKESCSAAVLEGTDIVYVLRVATRKIMSIGLGVGSRLPAYCTSMGRMLLAGLPDDEVVKRLRAGKPRALTRNTVTDLDALLAKVQQARRQGWCIVNQELEEGLISIAAPIFDRAGRTIAALNIGGQANRTGVRQMQEQLLPELRKAAGQVSRMLT